MMSLNQLKENMDYEFGKYEYLQAIRLRTRYIKEVNRMIKRYDCARYKKNINDIERLETKCFKTRQLLKLALKQDAICKAIEALPGFNLHHLVVEK